MSMWEYESEAHGGRRDPGVSSVDFDGHDSLKTDVFERRDQSWYISLSKHDASLYRALQNNNNDLSVFGDRASRIELNNEKNNNN